MITVKAGVQHQDVAVCQTILNALWCTDVNGKFLEIDGVCGEKTSAAIIEFQTTAKNNGLYDGAIDGVFGPKCWRVFVDG